LCSWHAACVTFAGQKATLGCVFSPYSMSDRTIKILSISFVSLLIIWGLYTLLYYLGVPVHQAVLLSEAGRQAVADACGADGGIICKGFNALFPFVAQTFTW